MKNKPASTWPRKAWSLAAETRAMADLKSSPAPAPAPAPPLREGARGSGLCAFAAQPGAGPRDRATDEVRRELVGTHAQDQRDQPGDLGHKTYPRGHGVGEPAGADLGRRRGAEDHESGDAS